MTLKFDIARFEMSLLCDILASCVNLQELEAPLVMIDGSKLHRCPVWATRKLRVLKLGVTRMTRIYENSLYLDVSREESSTGESLQSEARLAPRFMKQLGYQTGLVELELRLNDFTMIDDSPFLHLKVGPENGLDQLGRLHRLESLVILELLHDVGATEIAWMSEH